jgi:hypothetical protein
MADSYLAISQIAADGAMTQRVTACAAQQQREGLTIEPDAPTWTLHNRYSWASSPTWGEKWASALAAHENDPPPQEGDTIYQPGADPAVISDGDILSTVQALAT